MSNIIIIENDKSIIVKPNIKKIKLDKLIDSYQLAKIITDKKNASN